MVGGLEVGVVPSTLVGRDALVTSALSVLADGSSLLLTGRAGDGLTAVATAVVARHTADAAMVVTGLAGLTRMPLAALVVAGVIPGPRSDEAPASHLRRGLRALQVTTAARGEPVPLLVEGLGHLDDLTIALLLLAVTERTAQMVLAMPLGTDLSPLHPLLSSGLIHRLHLPPLADVDLRALAPDDADGAEVERALALADGSPLWFRACLASGWAADGDLPPALRDLADWHLSRLEVEVRRALDMVALAGTVPIATLVQATSQAAVSAARDGDLLRLQGDHLLVRAPAHRARLQQRAGLRRAELHAALRTAASSTGESLPLLPGDPTAVDAAALHDLVHHAPREVLDAVGRLDGPLPPDVQLARGRARLEVLDVDGAEMDLTALLAAPTPPQVRADAAVTLSILQAHMRRDIQAARATIHTTAGGIADPVLAGSVRVRQVTIEVYGYGMPQMDAVLPDPAEVPPTHPGHRLGVLKARGALHAGRASDVTAEDLPVIQDLLDRTGATGAERWEGLVPMMWTALMRDGFPPAMAIIDAELERARSVGDLAGIGAWLHSRANALALGGHTGAARASIQRALAALSTIDRFGLSPHLRLLDVRCLAHLGRIGHARAALATVDAGGSLPNPYCEALRDCAAAEIAAVEGDQVAACELLDASLTRMTRMGWSQHGWAQVTTSVADHIPAVPADLDGTREGGRLLQRTLELGGAYDDRALQAAHDLAMAGWVAAAAGGARRRAWSTVPPTTQLAAQHLITSCQAISAPGVRAPTGPASKRQLHVAQHAARGATDTAIAARLDLSRRTVSNHLSRLYEATGLSGRVELAEVLQPVAMWTP